MILLIVILLALIFLAIACPECLQFLVAWAIILTIAAVAIGAAALLMAVVLS